MKFTNSLEWVEYGTALFKLIDFESRCFVILLNGLSCNIKRNSIRSLVTEYETSMRNRQSINIKHRL